MSQANYGKKWTHEEETTLRDLFKADMPVNDIALVMGRSKGAILGRLYTLGLIQWDNGVRQYFKIVWLGRG